MFENRYRKKYKTQMRIYRKKYKVTELYCLRIYVYRNPCNQRNTNSNENLEKYVV